MNESIFFFKKFKVTIVDIPTMLMKRKLMFYINPKITEIFEIEEEINVSFNDIEMMKYLFDSLNIDIEEITKFLNNPYSLFIVSYINAPLDDEFEIVGIESEHDFHRFCFLINHTGYQLNEGFIDYFTREPEPDFSDISDLVVDIPVLQRWNCFISRIINVNSIDDLMAIIIYFSNKQMTHEEVYNIADRYVNMK